MTGVDDQNVARRHRVLVLEDVPEDVELLVARLQRGNVECDCRAADTESAFRAALVDFDPQLVLSDFALPGFDGMAALRIVREWSDSVPFIFVSGTFGEDVAVTALKEGATDYILKDRPERLASAVRRALEDADDRKRRTEVEAALRESEERLRLALAATDQGLYDLNVQSGAATVTPEYAHMLGYDPETFRETNDEWLARLHQDDRPRVEQVFREYIAGNLPEYRVEFRQRTASGDWKWILSLGKIVAWDSQGRPLRMLGTHTDISQSRRREEEIERLNAELEQRVEARTAELSEANRRLREATLAKSQFLANMSHELRTPLNAIIGFTAILREGLAGPVNDEQNGQLGMVYEAGTHLLELINEVLDLAKIEAGRMSVELDRHRLADIAHSAAETLRPLAEEKGLELIDSVEVDAEMTTDVHKVTQVLLNLLGNAIKFTEAGSVSLSAGAVGGTAVFTVSDTGPGILPEEIDRIFEEFYQSDRSGGAGVQGTGLGLSVSLRLAQMLGGTLTAQSVPGEGSSFTLSLPLVSTG